MLWFDAIWTAAMLAVCTYTTGWADKPGFMAGAFYAWSLMVASRFGDAALEAWSERRRAGRRGRD